VTPHATMPLAAPAAASLRLRDLLDGVPRPVRVLGGGRAAWYLEVGSTDRPARLVAVVTADATALPDAVQLTVPSSDHAFVGFAPDQPGSVGGGVLDLPSARIAPTRWWDPVPRLRTTAAAQLAAARERTAAVLDHTVRPVPSVLQGHLGAVADALVRDDAAAVRRHACGLVGAGEGSTPTGDDLLAGLVTTVLALARADGDVPLVAAAGRAGTEVAALASDRTTTLSAALLRAAADGAVCLPVAAWLHAVTGVGDLEAATRDVLAIGSVSGRDLLTGALEGIAATARSYT
jgi:hypothetical protein